MPWHHAPRAVLFACALIGVCAFLVAPAAMTPNAHAQTDPAAVRPENSADSSLIPELNVPIPGLELGMGEGGENPLFAQYIAGIYRFAISIVVVAATVMFIYGAFLYLLGSAITSIQSGKQIMIDAIVGMILLLSAYTILKVLNPDLVRLEALKVTQIKTSLQFISKDTAEEILRAVPRRAQLAPQAPEVPRGDVPTPSISAADYGKNLKAIVLPYVVSQSLAYDIHPCYAIATIAHESGWTLAIGHDENFNNSFGGAQLVNARLQFLRSGKKYSGETFSVDVPGDCSKTVASAGERAQCVSAHDSNILNDDKISSQPPDYGLDWRFSHGLGFGQATLFPNTKCADGSRGITYLGRCFTPPELMTVEGSVDATLRELKQIGAKRQPAGDPAEIFRKYIGGDIASFAVQQRKKTFEQCVNSGKY
jgi:hypothetical protein